MKRERFATHQHSFESETKPPNKRNRLTELVAWKANKYQLNAADACKSANVPYVQYAMHLNADVLYNTCRANCIQLDHVTYIYR